MSQVSAITTDNHCPEKSTVQRGEEEKKVDKGMKKGRSGPSKTDCGFITEFFEGLRSLVHKIWLSISQKQMAA